VSTKELLEILNDMIEDVEVKISLLTGDGGGGAAAHRLHKELIQNAVMEETSKKLICDMHNFFKPLEIACVDAWGRQGIGHRTPFQTVWLFVKLLKTVRKSVGRKGLNDMWANVVDKLRNDDTLQTMAREKCKGAFHDFMEMVEKLEMGTDEELDAAVKLTTEAPSNVQDPVFSRWGTVLAAIQVFVDNWLVVYFFAVAVKGDNKTTSYLWQLSCALLSLMNNKSKSNMEGESLESFVQSFTEENEPEDKSALLKAGDTPVFQAVLHFLNGFNKAYFQGQLQISYNVLTTLCCSLIMLFV